MSDNENSNETESEVERREPLEVGSPEHQAFERETMDRIAAADVAADPDTYDPDREGDDFDEPSPVGANFGQAIYLAHPAEAGKFPQPVQWTDERLPKGKIFIKSGDDPRSIEMFIRAMVADDAFRYDGFALLTLQQYAEQIHWSGFQRGRYAPEAIEALRIALTQLAEHREEEWAVYTEGLITGTLRKSMG